MELWCNGNPVLMVAYTESDGGHAFIVDGYLKRIDRTYASFVWDGSYKYTQEDIIKYEPWRFEEYSPYADEKGEYMERNLYYDEQINVAMNWGWSEIYDNAYYLLGRRSSSDSDFNYYPPYWYASGYYFTEFGYMAYDGYAE